MPYWTDRPGAAANLRLYEPNDRWRAHDDEQAGEDGAKLTGAGREIGSVLLNVLNATNVVLLTGTGSSFAASNPPGRPTPAGMADVWNAVRDAAGPERFDGIVGYFGPDRIERNIEKLLTMSKLFLELRDPATPPANLEMVTAFVAAAEAAIIDRVDFVGPDTNLDAHSAFIQKFGRRGVRKPRTKLFSTNYDLCFEEAARRARFTLIDGFSHGLDQTYDRINFLQDIVRRDGSRDAPDYVQNVLHLYKLHGSIDWRRMHSDIVRSRQRVGEPVLIYPRSSKFQESFDVPYLDMLSSFQAALREPDTALVVCGFGFHDDHISSPILSAVESNMSLRLVVCDPAFLPDASLEGAPHVAVGPPHPANRFLLAFKRLADAGDARVHLINGRFQDLAIAMPDLIGETDRERHVQRVRALRDAAVVQ